MDGYAGPVEQDGLLRYYAGRDAVVLAETHLAVHKICRISFGSDGSIYVQFPYFRGKSGIISAFDLPADPSGPVTYEFGKDGVPVSTDVNYSHHTSGIVKFSKHGTDIPPPRRQSFRLDGPIGQLFLLHAYSMAAFEPLAESSEIIHLAIGPKIKKKPTYFGFRFRKGQTFALKLRAEWRRKTDIVTHCAPSGSVIGPKQEVTSKETGGKLSVIYFGQPKDLPLQDHVLMVTASRIPPLETPNLPAMVFLGGWDLHEVSTPGQKVQLGGCLGFLYPTRDAEAG